MCVCVYLYIHMYIMTCVRVSYDCRHSALLMDMPHAQMTKKVPRQNVRQRDAALPRVGVTKTVDAMYHSWASRPMRAFKT